MEKKREHKRKQITIGLLLFMSALLLTAGVLLLRQRSAKNKGRDSAVCVTTPFLSGQGVVYEKHGDAFIIVTAGHLFTGTSLQDEIWVSFADGREEKAQLLYLSEGADVAFLGISNTESGKPVQRDRSRFDAMKEGDTIFAYSLEDGSFTKVAGSMLSPWIYLEDFSLNMSAVQIDGAQGMSGCGIYSEDGCFLGILCGVSEDEAAVLPFSVIESEWMMAQRDSQ